MVLRVDDVTLNISQPLWPCLVGLIILEELKAQFNRFPMEHAPKGIDCQFIPISSLQSSLYKCYRLGVEKK